MQSILEIRDIGLRFGGIQVLNDVSFQVGSDELVALIGPNGAGKSSLLNCISGFYRPHKGRIDFNRQALTGETVHSIARKGVVRTFQGNQLFLELSVVDNLMVSRHRHLRYNLIDAFLWWQKPRREEAREREAVERILEFLKLEAYRHAVVASLPYGLRKRVDLGRALALDPRLILLDEPMAGMNVEEKEDLARFVIDIREAWKVPVVLVEHDMGVVMDLADRVVVLHHGTKIADAPPAAVQLDDGVIAAYLGRGKS